MGKEIKCLHCESSFQDRKGYTEHCKIAHTGVFVEMAMPWYASASDKPPKPKKRKRRWPKIGGGHPMGCNAWNHPANCMCGWGGDGYVGGGGGGWGSGAFTSLIRKDWMLPHSLTTPNAVCPVCRARVFFYQNSTGSRVFFDALGPPWPKHSCTDNYGADISRRSRDWSAGVIRKVTQLGATPLRTIYLEVRGNIRTLFINDKAGLLDAGLPAYLFESGGYKLSAAVPLLGGVQIISVRAFVVAMDALKCKSEPKKAEPKVPGQPCDTPDTPEQVAPQTEARTEQPTPNTPQTSPLPKHAAAERAKQPQPVVTVPTTSTSPPTTLNQGQQVVHLLVNTLRSAAQQLNMAPVELCDLLKKNL